MVQSILAPPAGIVGVSMIVSGVLSAAVAPVVTLITPSVTEVTTVIFLVVAMVGIPLDAALQPAKVPRSDAHNATAFFVESISAAAPAALVRDV